MNNLNTSTQCRAVELDVLLFGDEQCAEYRTVAAHVETCRHCQSELAKLAAEESEWADVKTMLRRELVGPISESRAASPPDTSGFSLGMRSEPSKLDFLEPPSHPEMLGRLGRYEIEQVIGKGGMGIVLKGFDTELNRPVAIKVLAPHLAHSGPARQRFAREARAAASIVHEHVVAIHDVKSELESPYLVMQYVPGHSLQERVDQNGPLAVTEILRIGMQAAAGLAAAHAQGVIHRDVKPANILLENDVDRALLTDFGLARAADDATLTHSGIIAGTPHYMSPEQARGAQVDARSDLFGLGGVLYFMATGHPPFRAEQAMAILNRICHDRQRAVQMINPSIPDELADVIDRLLEKKVSRRFASARELQDVLAQILARIQARPSSRRRSWRRRLSRWRWPALFVAAIACVAAIFWDADLSDLNPDAPPVVHAQAVPEATPRDDFLVERGIRDREELTKFNKETAAIAQALSQIESNQQRDAMPVMPLGQSWRGELQTAAGQAAVLEQRWSTEPKTNSSKTSIQGE